MAPDTQPNANPFLYLLKCTDSSSYPPAPTLNQWGYVLTSELSWSTFQVMCKHVHEGSCPLSHCVRCLLCGLRECAWNNPNSERPLCVCEHRKMADHPFGQTFIHPPRPPLLDRYLYNYDEARVTLVRCFAIHMYRKARATLETMSNRISQRKRTSS